MREKKYRAWHKKQEKMIYDIEKTITVHDQLSGSYGETLDFDRYLKDEWFIVMQSTAEHDKHKNLIFESDFLKSPNGIYRVVFHGGGLCLIGLEADLNKEIFPDTDWYLPHSISNLGFEKEIIGNIYEDPGLLEK